MADGRDTLDAFESVDLKGWSRSFWGARKAAKPRISRVGLQESQEGLQKDT